MTSPGQFSQDDSSSIFSRAVGKWPELERKATELCDNLSQAGEENGSDDFDVDDDMNLDAILGEL